MAVQTLRPLLENLKQEYVLIQAWKKTAAYIRYHNWYSDTLELDRTTVNLPQFIANLSKDLSNPEGWISDPLRVVPAPKSQQWMVNPSSGEWGPAPTSKKGGSCLRPLAHVSLRDQVASTAIMLCLADSIETLQGDPRGKVSDPVCRKQVMSYGNRLFCDIDNADTLRHRWGSSKLYRAYYHDYQNFLTRPEIVAEAITHDSTSKVVILHSDLRQFYDRVRPQLLSEKLADLKLRHGDNDFFRLIPEVFNWRWAQGDKKFIEKYGKRSGIDDFSNVALPQGLVAAGFFANLVLLDFDRGIQSKFDSEVFPEVILKDACRYVDDLRLVLHVPLSMELAVIEEATTKWLQQLLDKLSPGLLISPEKTKAATYGRDERPIVGQSRKMIRIQGTVSGGFDAAGGEEILDAVQGLIRTQQRYSTDRLARHGWAFSPITDVRDATVERFAAARFRTTYRSLRALLESSHEAIEPVEGEAKTNEEEIQEEPRIKNLARTQTDLDHDARAFALGLIERWVEDPSNVRLLRIGLDIWPAADLLRGILDLLLPYTSPRKHNTEMKKVAIYCLSELFRAGAIETGFVELQESFPAEINIKDYRELLLKVATDLMQLPVSALPWYLQQQILLFLAANQNIVSLPKSYETNNETKLHIQLLGFLKKEVRGIKGADYSTLAVLARRCFCSREAAIELISSSITPNLVEHIGKKDPTFALELIKYNPDLANDLSPRLRDDLCLREASDSKQDYSLSKLVLQNEQKCVLRNEISLLEFAGKFLEAWSKAIFPIVITPEDVHVEFNTQSRGFIEVHEVRIATSRVSPEGSLYEPPPWCAPDERWRFQLGFLLRFILTAKQDFTRPVRSAHWKEATNTYRSTESHWYLRLYGLFNGHAAFGDDWLPITDWVEKLLFTLLRWPGCGNPNLDSATSINIVQTRSRINERLTELKTLQNGQNETLLLKLITPRPNNSTQERPLRACIVQTVTPTDADILTCADADDLTLSAGPIRKRHRNHLSAALSAVEKMLYLRDTHLEKDGRLDLLILPELAVHPQDIKTHLIPFARKHKTIILAGITYQEIFAGQPLVNSALWIIPVWSKGYGLQMLIRRQGKKHLAATEEALNIAKPSLQGWRPCQWLIGYEWAKNSEYRALWITGAICYDATDLALVELLRHHSDVFAVPSLNKDVTTFDHMALALHYHMYQYVIVANNGCYGGSNTYKPKGQPFERQIFHHHGQPQASIAFLEIDDIGEVIHRKYLASMPGNEWKALPAGISKYPW